MVTCNILKQLLEDRGLNRAQFQARVGKSKSAVCKWLSGEAVISRTSLATISSALDLSSTEHIKLLSAIHFDVIEKWRDT